MKRKLILLFSVIIVLMMSSFIQKKSKKIIFFGDSITEAGVQKDGYIDLVKRYAQGEKPDQFEIFGAGIGGNKVYDLFLRMEEDVMSKSPDIVFIYVGINDVWHKRTHATGTDADKFEKFYKAIIKRMKDQGIQVVICTPSVIGERNDYSNEQDGELNSYSAIIRRIAKENEVALVDLRKVFMEYERKNNPENLERGILTTDRVHLNATGNKLVADEMWKVLKEF
jgi:lysophospholipase L1-like esterase